MTATGASVTPLRIRDVVTDAAEALGSAPEARWIVAHATGMRGADLLAAPDVVVTPAVADAVRAIVDRCRAGEPLQYVLGTWAFRTLELHVDPRVLIPRPETELVVEVALAELAARRARRGDGAPIAAVDLGTGSGAIALSLAVEFESASARLGPFQVWATDVSGDALEVLDQNLAVLARQSPEAAGRVQVARGSWFDALPAALAGTLDLVVSNPPYVSASEWDALDPVVRDHEPVAALVPGPTGSEAMDIVLPGALGWLAPGGSLVIELAPTRADPAQERARALGFEDPEVRADLAGRPRVLVARRPEA
jgi:release factor glutamine methyltransferase